MDRPEVHVLDPDPGSVATIRSLLEEVGLPVTAHADPAELLAGEVLEQRPECVVSELALPGFNGLELQRRLACQRVPAPCIFVTAAATVPRAVQLMKEGAFDVFEKPLDDELAFVGSVQGALEQHGARLALDVEARRIGERFAGLSERGKQVVDLALRGLPSKAIARRLRLSKKTVDFHRAQALRTLGVSSMIEVADLRRRLDAVSA